MSSLSELLYLLAPLVLAGITNMVWVKLPVACRLDKPMDGVRVLRDGRRLLGANKTWKGFVGMIGASAWWLWVFENLALHFDWADRLSLIAFRDFERIHMGAAYGALWGLAYVLAELPNSFLKRRLNIAPGTQGRGMLGGAFILIDQADSVLGCVLILPVFYQATLADSVAIVALGTVVHLGTNMMLYGVGLKKNMG